LNIFICTSLFAKWQQQQIKAKAKQTQLMGDQTTGGEKETVKNSK